MEHILSLSYGKDSLACLFAIENLDWPLERIVHAEVWATDDISADPPPMVEFKAKADEIIKKRWGIKVEHVCATHNGEKLTYEKMFYHIPKRRSENEELHGGGDMRISVSSPPLVQRTPQNFSVARFSTYESKTRLIKGFPYILTGKHPCAWCKALKLNVFSQSSLAQGAKTNIVQYLGIAADEPERITRHNKPGFKMPLVEIGWGEAYCRKLCEENDLLSPIYTTSTRGGCWFCQNQSVSQLRLLRKTYPDLWTLLLKWDNDSPNSFKPDGHTVRDYDLRFQAEDEGRVPTDRKFRWKMLKED